MKPKVSFVVPCFNLAHLLPECIHSILSQTYQSLEVLIMDDCSPDDTSNVANSFNDSRVQHIRNDVNLGHLGNYNRGIELATGEFVWLISADDRLRSVHALQLYVDAMERNRNIAYVFCPAVGLVDGNETGILEWTRPSETDAVWNGLDFLKKLSVSNPVAAASGMVRRGCYQELGAFPLDLPYAGDWYLWCLFALHYDVAYFAEPMVNYRLHNVSMTHILGVPARIVDNVAVRWRMKRLSEGLAYRDAAEWWLRSICEHYAHCVYNGVFAAADYAMSLEEFERSLANNAAISSEARRIRGRVYSALGDGWFRAGDRGLAMKFYRMSVHQDCWKVKAWVKRALVGSGKLGAAVRRVVGPRSAGA